MNILSVLFTLSASLATLSAYATDAAGTAVSAQVISNAVLFEERIGFSGTPTLAMRVQDAGGRHMLVLSATRGPSRTLATKSRTDRTDLQISYFSQAGGVWREDWATKDYVDCPNLASSASFILKNVTVTDLNQDGVAEITVPYKLVCGEMVTPTLKLVLRQGSDTFTLQNHSVIKSRESTTVGSSYKADERLSLPQNAVYRQHLDEIWYQADGATSAMPR